MGGFLETVVEARTGVFFDSPEPTAIARAVSQLCKQKWDESEIRQWARRFSPQYFKATMRGLVSQEVPAIGEHLQ